MEDEEPVSLQNEPQLRVEKPSLEKVNESFKILKYNKVPREDGITLKLLKHSGKEMRQKVYELLIRIWEQ